MVITWANESQDAKPNFNLSWSVSATRERPEVGAGGEVKDGVGGGILRVKKESDLVSAYYDPNILQVNISATKAKVLTNTNVLDTSSNVFDVSEPSKKPNILRKTKEELGKTTQVVRTIGRPKGHRIDVVTRDMNEKPRVIKSKRGNPILVDSKGHHYLKDRYNHTKGTMIWTCRESKARKLSADSPRTYYTCNTHVTTKDFVIVKMTGDHTHPTIKYPDPDGFIRFPDGYDGPEAYPPGEAPGPKATQDTKDVLDVSGPPKKPNILRTNREESGKISPETTQIINF